MKIQSRMLRFVQLSCMLLMMNAAFAQATGEVLVSANSDMGLTFAVGGIFIEGELTSGTIAQSLAEAKTVSTTDDVKASFSLYPNPASDRVFVSGLDNKTDPSYRILNGQGAGVKTGTYTDVGIDIGPLTDGVYFLHLSGGEPVRFIKL